MIFTEIRSYDKLCATIRQLYTDYSGLGRAAANAIEQCTSMSAQKLQSMTEASHWYGLKITDDEMESVKHLFNFENAYGLIGRTILHDSDRGRLPDFLRKAKMADVTNPDFRPKARSYMLIWGYYTKEQARILHGDIFPELMNQWRKSCTHLYIAYETSERDQKDFWF